MNFEEQQGRQDYLNNKLDDLLEGSMPVMGKNFLMSWLDDLIEP